MATLVTRIQLHGLGPTHKETGHLTFSGPIRTALSQATALLRLGSPSISQITFDGLWDWTLLTANVGEWIESSEHDYSSGKYAKLTLHADWHYTIQVYEENTGLYGSLTGNIDLL